MDDDIYIGREWASRRGRRFLAASRWANPFKVHDASSRGECLDRYESHVRASPGLLAALPELQGRRLVCHCSPGQSCHGDVLVKLFA